MQRVVGGLVLERLPRVSAVVIIACGILRFAPPSTAATYYVDNSQALASDSNAGTESAPWSTIQHAADTVQVGDTVIVGAGTYDERATISSVSGTLDTPIVFRAQPRRSVNMLGFVIHGSDFIRVEGFNISNAIKSSWLGGGIWVNGSGIEVIDCYIAEIPGAGVQFASSKPWPRGCLIRNNKMFRCQFGMVVFAVDSLIESNEVERPVQHVSTSDADYARFFGDSIVFTGNYLHGARADERGTAHLDGLQIFSDNGYGARNCVIECNCFESFSQGVILEGKIPTIVGAEIRDIIIRNNLFLGTPELEEGWGVLVGEDTHEVYVYNNTFANMDIYGVGAILNSSVTARNNIFYNCKRAYFAKEEQNCNIVGGNNLIFPVIVEPHYDATDWRDVDPKFVDDANGNYRLSAGSPALDAGIDVDVPYDKDGNVRPMGPAIDIGAYERLPAPLITLDGGNGPGEDFATNQIEVTIGGTCDSGTRGITVNGSRAAVTYTSGDTCWTYTATLTEGSQRFIVIGCDSAGNASNPDSIDITLDSVRPDVMSAVATNGRTVRLVFSEAMADNAHLLNPAFYSFTGGDSIIICLSVVSVDSMTLELTTSLMPRAATLALSVGQGPTDSAGNSVAPLHSTASFVTPTFPSDVNCSGAVDAVDVQLIINAALGQPSEYDCDTNKDGAIDALDVQLAVNEALEIP